ncbi:MAG: tagaturonate reductase [Saprospiraceae bacterium]
MQKLNRQTAKIAKAYPEKILQFGGGNFLRGFVDWIVDTYNEKTKNEWGILVVKPTERGDYDAWRQQDGLFNVLTKGIKEGQIIDESYLVKSISRIIHPYKEWQEYLQSAENPDLKYIISNTTEMGIRYAETDKVTDAPPHEFPAKLTLWLHHRFTHFNGDEKAGCVLIPTELLIDNGRLLQTAILQYADNWQLENSFKAWIKNANIFCNTLVDRIIPGVSKTALTDAWAQAGFEDSMITQGEPYHFWAIEAPEKVRKEFPIDKIGLNVIYTDDLAPYRTIKVRILNGAHTTMVPVGYLYGIETVRETVEHDVMGKFVQQALFEEIILTLDLPDETLQQYAKDVLDRFKNPFIHHQLISISLNCTSKFKTRVLPSILAYHQKTGQLPKRLIFALASMIHFYKGENNGQPIPLKDDATAIAFLQGLWQECDGSATAFTTLAKKVLQWEQNWGQDLSLIEGFVEELSHSLISIEEIGIKDAISNL